MHYILAAHPAFKREHRQNQQRHQPDPRITQRGKRQYAQNQVRNQRHGQATHKTLRSLTHRSLAKCARDFASGLPLRSRPLKRLKFWCTGKDSNLRTSLGGTDLQSVGFNHSPTCADTAGRCSRCPSSSTSKPSSRTSRESADRGSTLLLPVRSSTFTNQTFASPNFAKQGNQESRYEFAARRSLHAGIVSNVLPNEVCWKNLLRHLVAETKNSAACRKSL